MVSEVRVNSILHVEVHDYTVDDYFVNQKIISFTDVLPTSSTIHMNMLCGMFFQRSLGVGGKKQAEFDPLFSR